MRIKFKIDKLFNSTIHMELTDVHVYVDAYISSHSTLLQFLVSSWLLCTWFPDFYWAIICNVLTTTPTLPLLKRGCWSLYVWGVWIWFYLDIKPLCMWCPLVPEEILREKPCEGRGEDWSAMDTRQWALMDISYDLQKRLKVDLIWGQEELS